MDPETQNTGPTNEELARWVRASGESEYVDAKGPMTWDGADASASLTKDIAAFANSRDGGVIVIGKSEADDGSFSLDGLYPEQAASFDTTKVGQRVNSRFAPPIRLVCHQAFSMRSPSSGPYSTGLSPWPGEDAPGASEPI